MDAEERFQALFVEAYPALRRYAHHRGLRGADAEDLVAEVLAVAWRRLGDVPTDAVPWLFAVARNLWRNDRRRESRRRRLAWRLPADVAVAPPVEPDDGDAQALRRALTSLPELDQEVLRLTAWEGLSAAQAGVVVGCSAGAVRVRLHRARARLAGLLAAAETPEHAATEPRHGHVPEEAHDG